MKFWFEWALAIHQAIWFPFNWVTGLERPSVALPVEYAPALMPAPMVETIDGKSRATRKKAKAS